MDPSCLVSMVQAGGGGVMVWGIFSWHTLGPLWRFSTAWYGTVRYGSLLGGFPLGTVPGT